jgi:DNA-binding GntR family transcriptional regulator
MPLAAPGAAGHRTKQQFVYRTLRDRIMRCDLRPGERLIIDDLAARLEVSAIPVREALQLLQSEGLVVTVPHVGATVAPITRESVQDIFRVLEGLEMVASRLAAERATADDLTALAGLVGEMGAAVDAGRYERWADLNGRFHLAISAITGLPMLRELTERVLDRWGRVRRFYLRGVLLPRLEEAQQEHRQILAALQSRDVERVERLIRQHNQNALTAYISYLDGKTTAIP